MIYFKEFSWNCFTFDIAVVIALCTYYYYFKKRNSHESEILLNAVSMHAEQLKDDFDEVRQRVEERFQEDDGNFTST
eukprot:CAMPEP_0114587974 /NCGR_PEP_ID=MMETSP0125-20121206/10797_1 /TAXON_ID=485358 ORGANISM="Aristerostoma sp., Strain ATCC 50986" /NCGR_SAMPLE_ID=MMETSP0125 /ASSEMBLY_ACC=CAM_ASM_000245 /LENGTH=76 /DNA_ID=CAMNT_0001784147 /DNA_START=670 /DNA_END=900 /DNA_ORIENTATION=-